VTAATNFVCFRRGLALWHSPSQNFAYADDRGNIGRVSAGYYAEVAAGDP
jgi:acyl-homoserine lactone acylase PvdQ